MTTIVGATQRIVVNKPTNRVVVKGYAPEVAATLNDLTDVSVASPTDNYALVFNSGQGLWVPKKLVDAAGDTMTGALTISVDTPHQLILDNPTNPNEGGQLALNGAASHNDWFIDNYSGSCRFIDAAAGSVRMSIGSEDGRIYDRNGQYIGGVQYNLYIPTLGGMNQGTGGAAQNGARYVFYGGPNTDDRGILAVQGYIKFGTTGRTFPTSPVTASLPSGFNVVYVGTNPASPIGMAWYGDGVSSTRYGFLQISSPTAVQFFYYGVTGSALQALSPTTPSSPITWQTGSDIAYAYTIQAVRVEALN